MESGTPDLSRLRYDSETGRFHWTSGRIAGTIDRWGYRQIQIGGIRYKAHRLAWLITFGRWPAGEVDHENEIKDDNRISNLRDLSHQDNQQNQSKPQQNNTTGRRGVSFCRRDLRWTAQIQVAGTKRFLGRFDSAAKAEQAYLTAKATFHPAWAG